MKKDEELGMKMINIFSHIHTFKWNSERKEVNYKICFEQIIHEAFYHNNKIKSLYKNFFQDYTKHVHSYTKTFFKRETNIILECPKTLKPIFHCFTSLNGYCENNSILQIHMHCIFPSWIEVWYWTQKPYKKCNWILIFISTYQ